MEALLILLAGCCDRIRGGFPSAKAFGTRPAYIPVLREFVKFGYGMVLASIITDVWWQIVAAGPLWWLGTRQDFGGMFRIYWPKPGGWIQIARVGLIWPLPVVALGYWNTDFLAFIPAALIGNCLAHLCALHTPFALPRMAFELETRPAWSEFYRGVFVAAILAGVTYA